MVKKEKDVIFLLDFDGVLFDTSLEAYYVMSETHEEGSINKNTIIDDKKYSKFIELRPFVTSAWQYYWVNEYVHIADNESSYEYFSTEKIMNNNSDSQEFEEKFLLNRKKLASSNYFNRPVSAPYKFWNMIQPLIELHPERFIILSTKDKESIIHTIGMFNKGFEFDDSRIFCKSSFKKCGENKHNVFIKNIKEKFSNKYVYIEDSHIHIKELYNEESVKCIRALWGYVPKNLKQNNSQMDAYKEIIKEF